MSKYLTESERDELWIDIRLTLVELGFMLKDGTPSDGNEVLCKKIRKLILVDATIKG